MKTNLINIIIAISAVLALQACNDGKTYAELLQSEDQYTNEFLSDQMVIASIPEDSVFEYGPNAPYYRIDEEGQLYMQVIDPGTPVNKVKDDELIYFRYTRCSLVYYSYIGDFNTFDEWFTYYGGGNEFDMSSSSTSFRYGNTSLSSSTQYGSGIQRPLAFLPVDCQVNLVIKSQYGFSSEMAEVKPYLFRLRYYRPQI